MGLDVNSAAIVETDIVDWSLNLLEQYLIVENEEIFCITPDDLARSLYDALINRATMVIMIDDDHVIKLMIGVVLGIETR
jgi:hypothetical protein